MHWLIFAWLAVTLYFFVTFMFDPISMDLQMKAKVGNTTHTVMVLLMAALWPIMLPLAIIKGPPTP